ncbi:MAG: 2-amino-4-hydroxy-6-hydroxymethyldihydropteridine diphosphokinase [Candidatus Nanopelagicales bacterium]|jgi:dihydroneopterin aldolase/2-amino-4-hydroxy-6-hydroxymethyldihydropteridine diphosphokinase|nr:2-amino-4-hydroxy-6-hydroxymethyldihydropteridine diphosphokinase [Candidatus Nanopelagicales bacterium]
MSESVVTRDAVVLSLGANLGDAADTLANAIEALGSVEGLEITDVSPTYRTAAVGGPEQPDYLNVVVLASTTLTPLDLLDATSAIEQAAGRTREVHWGPRTLDIDLIVVGDQTRSTERLTLPHPRAHERAFVLLPWLDVDPRATIPGLGPVVELIAHVQDQRADRVA